MVPQGYQTGKLFKLPVWSTSVVDKKVLNWQKMGMPNIYNKSEGITTQFKFEFSALQHIILN